MGHDEEMKTLWGTSGGKRGHTCASLSYDSDLCESSMEVRAPRPFHVKMVMLKPTCL